jgi:hypothetical protein
VGYQSSATRLSIAAAGGEVVCEVASDVRNNAAGAHDRMWPASRRCGVIKPLPIPVLSILAPATPRMFSGQSLWSLPRIDVYLYIHVLFP